MMKMTVDICTNINSRLLFRDRSYEWSRL